MPDRRSRKHLTEARKSSFETVLEASNSYWQDFTGVLQIETPDKAFNNMVNAWLPYQSTRLPQFSHARPSIEASGAVGFRDQLQDTLAFIVHRPELARAQILNAAARRFIEGDVLHWWLPNTGAGVRTLISDDVVWLGHAVQHCCSVTQEPRTFSMSRSRSSRALCFWSPASMTASTSQQYRSVVPAFTSIAPSHLISPLPERVRTACR